MILINLMMPLREVFLEITGIPIWDFGLPQQAIG